MEELMHKALKRVRTVSYDVDESKTCKVVYNDDPVDPYFGVVITDLANRGKEEFARIPLAFAREICTEILAYLKDASDKLPKVEELANVNAEKASE